MVLGRLELQRGQLAAAQLSEDLSPLLLGRGLGQRALQPGGRRAGGAAARSAGRGRPERGDPLVIAVRGGQQQVGGDAFGGRARGGQDPGRRRVPRLALAGREILIQRGPDDRVHVPQALGWIEQARPDQGVGGLAGGVRAQARQLRRPAGPQFHRPAPRRPGPGWRLPVRARRADARQNGGPRLVLPPGPGPQRRLTARCPGRRGCAAVRGGRAGCRRWRYGRRGRTPRRRRSPGAAGSSRSWRVRSAAGGRGRWRPGGRPVGPSEGPASAARSGGRPARSVVMWRPSMRWAR